MVGRPETKQLWRGCQQFTRKAALAKEADHFTPVAPSPPFRHSFRFTLALVFAGGGVVRLAPLFPRRRLVEWGVEAGCHSIPNTLDVVYTFSSCKAVHVCRFWDGSLYFTGSLNDLPPLPVTHVTGCVLLRCSARYSG